MSLTAAAVAVMMSVAGPGVDASNPSAAPTTISAEPVIISGDVNAPAVPAAVDAPSVDAAPALPPAGADAAAAPQTPDTEGTDIIVTARHRPPRSDPLERVNEKSFEATQAVDRAVIEPVTRVYNKGPRPIRQGLRNFFTNLDEPVIFAAYLLEFKPGKAAETAGRFVVNSTLGVAGIFDIAKRKPFNLPYRPNGVADVLGYYGVGPGPYFYLPIVGPTTLRDFIGDTLDNAALPAVVGKPLTSPYFVIPSTILGQLGERAAFDDQINRIRDADNPYKTYRELYLKQRKAEIDALHGRMTPGVVPVYGPDMQTDKDARHAKAAHPADPGPPPAPVPAAPDRAAAPPSQGQSSAAPVSPPA